MLTVKDTALESYQFGSKSEDTYYVLIDLVRNPDGVNITQLANADPRTFDTVLADMGCVLMLSGDEMDELIRRGDVDSNSQHESLFLLTRSQGLI